MEKASQWKPLSVSASRSGDGSAPSGQNYARRLGSGAPDPLLGGGLNRFGQFRYLRRCSSAADAPVYPPPYAPCSFCAVWPRPSRLDCKVRP